MANVKSGKPNSANSEKASRTSWPPLLRTNMTPIRSIKDAMNEIARLDAEVKRLRAFTVRKNEKGTVWVSKDVTSEQRFALVRAGLTVKDME